MVDRVGHMMHHIVRLCHPILKDKIIYFVISWQGISIYKLDCAQLVELPLHFSERIVEAVWDESYAIAYSLRRSLQKTEVVYYAILWLFWRMTK